MKKQFSNLLKITFHWVAKYFFHFLDQLSAFGLHAAVVVVEGFGKEGNRVRQDCQIVLALLVQEQVYDVQDEQANLKKIFFVKFDLLLIEC